MNKKASNYRKYKEHKNTTSTICNVVIITRFCSSPQSRTVSCQASSFTSPSPWTPSPTPRLLQWTLRVTLSKYISNLVQLKTFYGQSSCRSGKSLFSFSFLQKQPLSQRAVRNLLTMTRLSSPRAGVLLQKYPLSPHQKVASAGTGHNETRFSHIIPVIRTSPSGFLCRYYCIAYRNYLEAVFYFYTVYQISAKFSINWLRRF